MVLDTAVSSMKTSRFGSSHGCRLRNASRAAATSGRSCSAACRLFFKGQVQMPQKSEDRRKADLNLVLRQSGCNLRQRNIGLLRHPLSDPLLVRGQSVALVTAKLRRTDASGLALAPQEAADRTQADVMLLGGFRARRALLDRRGHAGAQIVRIRLRHSLLAPAPVQILNLIRARMGIPDSIFSTNALVFDSDC